MPGRWKEVVRLRFKGNRFRDHALDLSALVELSQFQKLVAETAKALWRVANPDRERLPRHFEERTRLCLRKIDEGSAVAPLEVYAEESGQLDLWEPEPVELEEAIKLAYDVVETAGRGVPPPERLPKHLVAEYAKWGQSLGDDGEMEIEPPGRPAARVSSRCRRCLQGLVEGPYEAATEVVGRVLEADVRQRRFQLWTEGNVPVSAPFDEAQEELVTTALRDHKTVLVRAQGRGEHASDGQLVRLTRVDSLEPVPLGDARYDASAPAIEEVLAAIAAEVPKGEWDRLPADLSDNLDHYIYGTPRR